EPVAVGTLAAPQPDVQVEPEAVIEEDVLDVPELPPGEAALMTATERIRRHRLTQPAGASAMDSLLDAHRLLGRDARVTAQAERWFATLHPYLGNALDQRDDAAAVALLAQVERL